ncbi:MAG: 3-isopropylmalate dehydrogenase [Melioribacter sp.]|uniref:3-isopropylmalate dehydrogenase n=1 Tax=Rosettibacter primus TaxID=3111523 RepID=UPI00247B9316|nr:3-isopropylmalate dehydrogenase [Melioribacter sp.]
MYKITLLPGDGIGPEVTNAAVKVLKVAGEKFNTEFEFATELIGGASYDKYSTPLTDEALGVCYSSDAVFLGAVGGPKWENLPHHLKPEAALLKLRKALGLYANLRPAKVYTPMLSYSSLKEDVLKGTDVLIVRELTGGIYFGEPRGYDENKGFNTMIYTKEEVERIAKTAFELAKVRNRKVTSVDKANVLEVSQFWRKVVIEVHKNYPDIELNHMYVDNAAMQLVRYPKQFDVVLTSNLFGDILSDIAAMITGSLGMLPSASLGEKYALYEPVHGSAPDIAGKNIANPIAAISSAAMMLKYSFQMDKAADLIENAIENVLLKGFRTKDIYKDGDTLVSTDEMTEKIIEEFEKLFAKEALNVFTL